MRKTRCQAQTTAVCQNKRRRRRAWPRSIEVSVSTDRDTSAGARDQNALVRSCCFSACRSIASAISRSISAAIGHAARRPHLRVHADRREAGDGVDLVDVERAAVAATAGSRRAPCRRRRWRGTRRSPGACTSRGRRRVEVGGDHRLRPAVEVLRLVVVELARRDDLAGHRRLGLVVAEHGALDLARLGTAASTTDLAVEREGRLDRRRQRVRRLRLRDADARSEIGRLHEHRQPERRRAALPAARGRRVHSCVTHHRIRRCGRPCAANTTFITALSMPTADASTPDPTYGTLASSSSPCTVPSSPYGPCSTGKTTSRPRPVTTRVGLAFGVVAGRPALDRDQGVLARVRHHQGVAAGARQRAASCWRACSITSAAESAVGGRSASAQRPSFSMRIGTAS